MKDTIFFSQKNTLKLYSFWPAKSPFAPLRTPMYGNHIVVLREMFERQNQFRTKLSSNRNLWSKWNAIWRKDVVKELCSSHFSIFVTQKCWLILAWWMTTKMIGSKENYLKSILPNFDIFVFLIFAFKLGHFKVHTIFSHATNTQA